MSIFLSFLIQLCQNTTLGIDTSPEKTAVLAILEKQNTIAPSMQNPTAGITKGTIMTQEPIVGWAIFLSNTIRDFPSSEHTETPAICYTGSSVTGADSKLVESISSWQEGPWDLGTGESFGAAGWLLLADSKIWILKLGSKVGLSFASLSNPSQPLSLLRSELASFLQKKMKLCHLTGDIAVQKVREKL